MTGIVLQWPHQPIKKTAAGERALHQHHWSAALHVRIFTMGDLRVLFNEQHSQDMNSVESRATELLKVIVALGGRNVSENKIAAAMWPCSDSHKACERYDAAMMALQNWLNGIEVLIVENGLVSLDERHCWVDTWALDRCFAKIHGTLADTSHWQYQWQDLAAQTDRLVRLYHGDFLQGERMQVWSFALRERLRHTFVRTMAQVGRHWRRIGDINRAIQCCRKGLAIDRLAEPLYQLLIRCVMQQGRLSEALSIYHDYRTQFVKLLGVEPSLDAFAVLTDDNQEGLRLP